MFGGQGVEGSLGPGNILKIAFVSIPPEKQTNSDFERTVLTQTPNKKNTALLDALVSLNWWLYFFAQFNRKLGLLRQQQQQPAIIQSWGQNDPNYQGARTNP